MGSGSQCPTLLIPQSFPAAGRLLSPTGCCPVGRWGPFTGERKEEAERGGARRVLILLRGGRRHPGLLGAQTTVLWGDPDSSPGGLGLPQPWGQRMESLRSQRGAWL